MKTKIYGVLLAIILLGYGFFFTSSFWFHDEIVLRSSPMDSVQKLSETAEIQLENWVYSPTENKMSVMFSTKTTVPGDMVLNMAAYEIHSEYLMNIYTGSTASKLPVQVIYPFGNMVVVLIDNVPNYFDEVVLKLQLRSEDDSAPNKIVTFYTNKKAVAHAESIEGEDTDYRIVYLQMQIEDKKEQIKEIEEENKKLEKSIESYQKEIDALIANQEYETAEEVIQTEKTINTYRLSINTNQDLITKNKYKIEERNKNIRNIEEIIAKQLQKTTEEESSMQE